MIPSLLRILPFVKKVKTARVPLKRLLLREHRSVSKIVCEYFTFFFEEKPGVLRAYWKTPVHNGFEEEDILELKGFDLGDTAKHHFANLLVLWLASYDAKIRRMAPQSVAELRDHIPNAFSGRWRGTKNQLYRGFLISRKTGKTSQGFPIKSCTAFGIHDGKNDLHFIVSKDTVTEVKEKVDELLEFAPRFLEVSLNTFIDKVPEVYLTAKRAL